MKLTPLDIHHKEFHRAIRGYSEEEVDKFLDEVAEEFERLFKENIELKEQVEKAKNDLEKYSGMERTLQNALLTAQKSADDVATHAQKEAELIIRDAELKAKGIVQEAHDLKRKYESSLVSLKQAEEEFRTKFKAMLESYMRIADSTAALADIGSNIIDDNDKLVTGLEELVVAEHDLSKVEVVTGDASRDEQAMTSDDGGYGPHISNSFTTKPKSGGANEPAKSTTADVKEGSVDKSGKSDIDSLAF